MSEDKRISPPDMDGEGMGGTGEKNRDGSNVLCKLANQPEAGNGQVAYKSMVV